MKITLLVTFMVKIRTERKVQLQRCLLMDI